MRVLKLLWLFLPIAVAYPLTTILPSLRHRWMLWLMRNLELAGPTFVKLGQWASTRPDVFSITTCRTLGKLHDNVDTIPITTVLSALESELSPTRTQTIQNLNANPLGSGCIAQVHEGEVEGVGRVAVKVRRPGVVAVVCADLNLISTAARILDWFSFLKPLRLPEAAARFGDFMFDQLSLVKEARNLDNFQKNFSQANRKGIVFPKPVWGLVEEGVLVETFEEGVTLASVLRGEQQLAEADRVKVGNRVLDAFLSMVFVDNCIHGDLHPGNVLVRNHGNDIAILDAGLVTRLSDKDRHNFIDLVGAVATGRGEAAARLMIERGGNSGRVKDEAGFIQGLKAVVDGVSVTSFRLAEVKIGDVLSKVLSLVRHHQVHLDAVFANLVISIVVLEGVGRQLGPEVDLFQRLLPLLPKADQVYLDKAVDILTHQ